MRYELIRKNRLSNSHLSAGVRFTFLQIWNPPRKGGKRQNALKLGGYSFFGCLLPVFCPFLCLLVFWFVATLSVCFVIAHRNHCSTFLQHFVIYFSSTPIF
eukprot:TRINITY_DN164486_c0_g1_i1.p1 TRINITY_DN164486_c0_g1~~TRINITY_DN164486_c0_g1_i1.p1  ORF type:complete len:101 (-),score=4.36 TRINITY_DN164486_c0_g1_i1:42-344(-)